MPKEIERKFLVHQKKLPALSAGQQMDQGYLPMTPPAVVRVRRSAEQAWLTIKSETSGMTRDEYEYPIPVSDANELLALFCSDHRIQKTRYEISHEGYVWELDIFEGDNAGLIVAEIELDSETDSPPLPDWVSTEVTGDPRYFNSNLVSKAYVHWHHES